MNAKDYLNFKETCSKKESKFSQLSAKFQDSRIRQLENTIDDSISAPVNHKFEY